MVKLLLVYQQSNHLCLSAKFHSCLPAAIVTIHHEPKGKANIENFQQYTLWNFGSGTQNLGVP